MIELANRLNELAAQSALFVTETADNVILVGLNAQDAAELIDSVRGLGWPVAAVNGAHEEVEGEINPAYDPYRLTIVKPQEIGRLRFLTMVGFESWLSDSPSGLVQVATAQNPLETGTFRVGDWNDKGGFELTPKTKSPRTLVREVGNLRSTPEDIRPWVASKNPTPVWADPIFSVWRKVALMQGLRSLATEVHAGKEICFSGSAHFWMTEPDLDELDLSEAKFWNIQKAVAWVYENPSDAETRFRLLNYEFGRLGRSGRGKIKEISEYAPIALESARLAFQYSLAKVSSDSAKALSDLRKSLSEETTRLSEMVRQIISAVSGAVFVGIGLIAARFSTSTPKIALFVMGLVVCGYVTLVIVSGLKQISLQREMRTVWRNRLYGYISNDDYKTMILDAAGKSEDQFHQAAISGGLITFLIMTALTASVFAI